MTPDSDAELAASVASLRRERRRGRVSEWLILPGTVIAFVLAGDRLWVPLVVFLLLNVTSWGFTFVPMYRGCPRCGGDLRVEHWGGRSLPPCCPHCQLRIEPDREPIWRWFRHRDRAA